MSNKYLALAKDNFVVNIVVVPGNATEEFINNLGGDWDEAYEYDYNDPILIGDVYNPEIGDFVTPQDDVETPEVVETVSVFRQILNFFRRT